MEKQTRIYQKTSNILCIIFLLNCILSCSKNKKELINNDTNRVIKKEMNIKIDQIKKHIKLQERVESDEEEYDNPYDLTFRDLELCSQIIDEALQKNGYKNISDAEFAEKLNLVFNVNLKKTCENYSYDDSFITLFGYKMDGNLKTLMENQYGTYFNTQNLFMSEKKHFLFQMFFLKEIIKINHDDSYILTVPEYIISRNKYLFNDNKASLVWLKFHDQYFLESLVKVFGYVGDKDLLKWVLDRSLSDDKSKEEEFYKILVTKTCDNKYIFHKEVFEVMTQADDKSKKEYLLLLKGRIDLPKLDDLNFSEAAKIEALYCYYATKFTASIERGDVYAFFPKLNDPKFEEEFRKNNYYNIPDFKELYNDTKLGGIGLPM